MKLYFALTVPDATIARVSSAVDSWRSSLGDDAHSLVWSSPSTFHFTLKYLGDPPAELAARASEATRAIAAAFRPFSFTPAETGVFPSDEKPEVLWIGVGAGAKHVLDLATRIDQAMAALGFPLETRPYRAHLTLARAKGVAGRRVLRALRARPLTLEAFEPIHVERFALMKSTPAGSGSRHSVIERLELHR